jgi:hypothetical protein
VSSFSLTGTNAHVVLQEAPEVFDGPSDAEPGIATVSAKSWQALARPCDRLSGHLRDHPDLDFGDVVHVLNRGRDHHRFRAAFPAGSIEDLVADCAGRVADSVAASRPPTRWCGRPCSWCRQTPSWASPTDSAWPNGFRCSPPRSASARQASWPGPGVAGVVHPPVRARVVADVVVVGPHAGRHRRRGVPLARVIRGELGLTEGLRQAAGQVDEDAEPWPSPVRTRSASWGPPDAFCVDR